MIELNLPNKDARQLAKQVRASDVDSLQWIATAIDTELADQTPKDPWRNVVGKSTGIGSGALFLKLECGHSKTFSGTDATFNAEDYKRVRCEKCEAE